MTGSGAVFENKVGWQEFKLSWSVETLVNTLPAADLAEARLRRLLWFAFACFGPGWYGLAA